MTIEEASNIGNVDGDSDFDANDSFLLQLVKLAGTDQQIDQSKGASSLTAAEIRANINNLGNAADVDGDNDFDANDAFLIHLVKLSGTDQQIDQSKGTSSLSAAQIRSNVNLLGAGSGSQLQPVLASAPTETDQPNLFESDENQSSTVVLPADAVVAPHADSAFVSYREWIDSL